MGFLYLFWGFLFQFDFRVGTVDLLPDFIGYLLFWVGVSKLLQTSEWFRKARPLCAVMIVLSLPSIVEMPMNETGSGPNLLILLYALIVLILDLYIVYYICQATISLAETRNDVDLANKAGSRWKLYLLLQLLVIVFYLGNLIFPLMLAAAGAFMVIVMLVLAIAVLIMMMTLMHQASKRLQV